MSTNKQCLRALRIRVQRSNYAVQAVRDAVMDGIQTLAVDGGPDGRFMVRFQSIREMGLQDVEGGGGGVVEAGEAVEFADAVFDVDAQFGVGGAGGVQGADCGGEGLEAAVEG